MKIERNAIQEYLEAIVDSTAIRCVFTVDTLSPELYSVARFYYGRFMSSFMKLPFITRFFLSISFTFALAAMSLKVIFFFMKPTPVAPPVVKKEEAPREGMRRRRRY